MSTYEPSDASQAFLDAAAYMTSAAGPSNLSSDKKLELYGLYKFTITDSTEPQNSRPSIFDLAGRAKWDAWKKTGKQYVGKRQEAEKCYIEIAKGYGWKPTKVQPDLSASQSQEPSAEELLERDSPEPGSSRSAGAGMGLAVSTVSDESDIKPIVDVDTLHGFALAGEPDKIVQYLKDHPNADLNRVDEFGYTCLHLGSDRGNADVIALLLEKGADASLRDQDGFTAEDLAREAKNDAIVAILEAHRLKSTDRNPAGST